ncbi:hypothetical protein INT43_001569 [Umbelopsis isabellina]|uniref:Uncharacterized protein n=1 Tax=Mortierella isabellina TaxID=91625 RepID=A0A8H7PDT8_MORIS|nr:hypothetical protein INT43_001569 [Umbelopsis isabellina]
MDPSARRYQLSAHHNPSLYEIIDSPRELNDWNPYDVPWDTKRRLRVSCTSTKDSLTKYTSSDIDHQCNINEDEWYCDSGSSSSSTSSNDRITPRRSGDSLTEERSRPPGAAWRARISQGGEDTVQKKNKKPSSGKKVSLPKDSTLTRNKHQIQNLSTKDGEEKTVKTDEIALFMRCKKRPSDIEVLPIPPSPGGWDDVIPDRTMRWGEVKAHSGAEKVHGQQSSWSSGNDTKLPRDEKNKRTLRHDPPTQHSNRPKSSTRTNSKITDSDRHDMLHMKNASSQNASSSWREKHAAARPQAILKNDMSSSFYNVPMPMPMDTRYKHSGQFYAPPTHPAYADMSAAKAYPTSDMLPSKSNPIASQRQWRSEQEACHAHFANETPQMMSNEQTWHPDSFSSHWDPQPRIFHNSEPQNPVGWKERKYSLDSVCPPHTYDMNTPMSSIDLQSRPNWPSIPSIWGIGPQETSPLRPRRASADVGTFSTAPRMGAADWQTSNGLEDWSSMNKNVGSLMRLLEEDVTPTPARIPHEKIIHDISCHAPAEHHHNRLFDNDTSSLPQPSCNHCGAVSNHKALSSLQDPSWR